jgi:DNA mismatch repair protein MutS2
VKLSQLVRVSSGVPPEPLDAAVDLSILEPAHGRAEVAQPLREALVFAFATGDGGNALEQAVASTPLSSSPWRAEDFVGDVFLQELISRCLPIRACGQGYRHTGTLLERLLAAPPPRVDTALLRQAVFAELASNDAPRRGAEELFAKVALVRSLLARAGGLRIDALERRLSILRAVRDAVDLTTTAFPAATSALARVTAWGLATRALPAFRRLAELLSYEQCTAEIDVRLRLGVDGKVRDFEVLGRREPVSNEFHRTRAQRLLTKLSLFFHGERFDDHELLARLVDDVFEGIVDLIPPLLALSAGLEFYLAGLAFRDTAASAGLPVVLPTFATDAGHAIEALWNPLLLPDAADREAGRALRRVVPCDLNVGGSGARVIVTGPNSGGKTRLLQAVALTQILAQAGMFVPAASARIPWASGLFVSLIEHARADQAEGRLGTELLRIRRLFESLEDGSLVILDELCSGTNPDEGEDIFRLVVKLLAELRPAAFITTHFLRFAARLEAEQALAHATAGESGLEFLRVELDVDENPTFQFVPGVAPSSLAHRTATRLGVTEEALRAAMRGAPNDARGPRVA